MALGYFGKYFLQNILYSKDNFTVSKMLAKTGCSTCLETLSKSKTLLANTAPHHYSGIEVNLPKT